MKGSMLKSILPFAVMLLLISGFLIGCGDNPPANTASATPHKHEHIPPHGGTPVVLGDEEYHVEMVLDAPAGKLQAFVLDGEMENFIRIAPESFEVNAKPSGKEEILVFKAVANHATGEKVGDTSLFETQADWLKTETNFEAVLKEITVKSKTYQNVAFNFPKGNDKDETEKNKRKSRAEQAAERSSYVGMALGIGLLGAFIALVVCIPPVYSVREMAMAQVVRKPTVQPPASMASPTPIHGSSIAGSSQNGTDAAQAPMTSSSNAMVVGMPEGSESNSSGSDHYRDVGYDRLAGFRFDVTDEMLNGTGDRLAISLKVTGQIPPAIKDLNEQQVAVRGFMLPLSLYHGQATEFLLLRNQGMCCYGKVPKMNEWVTVRMPGAGVKPVMDKLVKVTGTFHVGETRENGLLTAIYRLDADKMDVVSQP
jgi:hypothetical protein